MADKDLILYTQLLSEKGDTRIQSNTGWFQHISALKFFTSL